MLASIRRRVATVAVAVVALAVVSPGVAQAAPPTNDDFDASTAVTALPFTAELDTSEATGASDDPAWCQPFNTGGTVWFSYTPTEDVLLRATAAGSDHWTILSVNTGVRGELGQVTEACDIGTTSPAAVTFRATAGTTYHFMVAGYDVAGGALSFGLETTTPAPNDAFADAEPIAALPATRVTDLSVASTEYDEPSSSCAGPSRTVWYSFTPAETTSLLATVDPDEASVEVYTGSVLPELATVGCARGWFFERVLFRAVAGTTYHLRVGGTTYEDTATLSLAEAPALQPGFDVSPNDPTSYELTRFNADTGEFDTPVASAAWDFGDGGTARVDGAGVSHHYTADGTYEVRLDVVSEDGRTASVTRTVTVSTHDVSIAKFVVPSGARTGETKEVAVRVANTRYREPSVTTELYKSDGSSWRLVGTLTLDVPAHPTRTVLFPFAYTFTAADAVVGKVAFRAVVRLPYEVRDARPFDNELISKATTVRPSPADLRFA